MFSRIKKQSILLSIFCLLLTFSQATFASNNDWREVTAAERQMTAPKVEADADAEVIFWEVRIDDSSSTNLVMKHYVRVKIFTERGREKYSKIDIPFIKGMKVKNVAARVIRPDGSIVEITKADVFEREIAKTQDIKVKAKSFAVPNIEPGVIVEYRYEQSAPGSVEDMRLSFQHDIPIQNITYFVKPYYGVKYLLFNMGDKFVKDKGGFYRVSMDNVPALKEEPRMPPEDEVKAWTLLYYLRSKQETSNDFWARYGGYLVYSWDIKDTLKPGKDLKQAATQIAAGASTPEDQIAKIYEFSKTKIKNLSFDPQMTDEDREKYKPNKSTGDTYKKMQGMGAEINELFASLATALGFEARLAFGGNRSEKYFDPKYQAHESFVHFSAIAVKVNGQWRYYDPGSLFTPYGMLPWYEEDTAVLLLGHKDYITTKTPLSGPEKSVGKRTGKFKLLEDGTLEGTVKIEYTGHLAYRYKLNNHDESPVKREENLKAEIQKHISTAEISSVSIENVSDPEKPFIYQFKVRVPNYAQKTGKRMFLQPGFFEYGKKPEFTTSTRNYPIAFSFPWSEEDDIEIELPKGFELDSADSPAEVTEPNKITRLKISIGVDKDTTFMRYKRQFYFGGGGNILFPVSVYEPLKSLFDLFNKADSHTITLRQK